MIFKVACFKLVLDEVQELTIKCEFDSGKLHELGELIKGCHHVLIDL